MTGVRRVYKGKRTFNVPPQAPQRPDLSGYFTRSTSYPFTGMRAMQWNLRRYVPADWKALAIPLTLIGGVITFFYHWASDIDVRDRESRKPFLALQLDTYAKILPVVATIRRLSKDPSRSENPAYTEALGHFWDFYSGLLAMVEDEQVEEAMVLFGKTLIAEEQKDAQCADIRGRVALVLDHCARNSIAASWGVKMPQATNYCTSGLLHELQNACKKIPTPQL